MNGPLAFASRRGAALSLAAAACGVPVSADRLVVVYDAGGTVPAAPYLERPALSRDAGERALDRALRQLPETARAEEPAFSPVDPGPLRAGPPSRKRIPGLARPVFAVGADPASLEWLVANAARLRRSGAQGFLASAPTEEAFSRARATAAWLGLWLEPLSGDALADAYGARSYPFVAEPSP